jgi:hypothetical protein
MIKRSLNLPSCCELAVSPRDTYVAALGRDVVVANLVSRKRCFSSRALAHPAHAAFSDDETQMVVKNTSGDIVTLDMSDGRVVARSDANGYDEGAGVHYSPCGEFVVEGSWNGAIRVRRADSLAVVEEFTFPDEMVSGVSRTSDGSRWLFTHQPKTRDGENWPPPPYLTVWDWPLRTPSRTLDPRFYSVGAASISPCGSWIASVGNHHALPDGTLPPDELRISDLFGEVQWATHVIFAGTAYRARWSADSRLVGTIDRSGILIFAAQGLVLHRTVPSEFPSDIAFVQDGACAVLGTWPKAWLETL